jgi:hypothetical protein
LRYSSSLPKIEERDQEKETKVGGRRKIHVIVEPVASSLLKKNRKDELTREEI